MELYQMAVSPPCRAVRVLARELGLTLKLVEVDLTKGDHLKPDYLKLNPFHKIPVFKDNDLVLFESHAILLYLINKYAPGNSLYPQDSKQRALVDAMLFYNANVFQPGLSCFVTNIVMKGTAPAESMRTTAASNFKELNSLLEKRKFAAGDSLTVADVAIVHSLVYAQMMGLDLTDYLHLNYYAETVRRDLQFFHQENDQATEQFGAFIRSKLEALSKE